MKTRVREWDWWAYLFRVVHRSQIPGIGEWDDELVKLIVEVLALQPGARVLDLACGSGEHTLRLAERGLSVVGLDIAPSLIAHCRARAETRSPTPQPVRFEVADMRELAYRGEFDAVLMLSGSFGFFDDDTNRDVLQRVAWALKPKGRVLIDVFDPAQMVVRPPRRSWSEYGGGIGFSHRWWEPETCTYVSEFSFLDGEGVLNRAAEPERIRVYSLPEWRRMLADVGLTLAHALAETRLPATVYDRDHYGNLVIVGQSEPAAGST
jgi:SAM-dependent methyltransferase